mmetsp:Transcript_16412/g.37640  ORF Transcript_16412/g.37640 Transcript_16412/m.37640 type:complete len:486 (-) Transcript_16412:215-1672(-)|eukprot:CAMPEP_0201122628 /NCGR_PEP_ID=MMETSP0850-20130426/6216_1 /ASSEMBLY_ACC=CAM_ASM_000622 /TAXON_ID=183588 /ORGANISM="Pseudo-nitzschia fraudulenta, Strain WWA7" /LENGTH=485 /DNA_ID=CAMNT_0047389355 /DNA_START=13 /DNA_END=1470 /DNA_ORIENTATION=-
MNPLSPQTMHDGLLTFQSTEIESDWKNIEAGIQLGDNLNDGVKMLSQTYNTRVSCYAVSDPDPFGEKQVGTNAGSAIMHRRANSLPQGMHLIFRGQDANKLSGSTPARLDSDDFELGVLSDLRETSASPRRKELPSSARTNPGYFMRGLLLDLLQVDTCPTEGTAESTPPVSPRTSTGYNTTRKVQSDLQKSDSSGLSPLGSPLKSARGGKNKDFSFHSVLSAKYSMATDDTASMTTDDFSLTSSYSSHTVRNTDGTVRLASDRDTTEETNDESHTDDDSARTVDDSKLTSLRRQQIRRRNLYPDSLYKKDASMSRVGKSLKEKTKTTPSPMLFVKERTKPKCFEKSMKYENTDGTLMSLLIASYPEENCSSMSYAPRTAGKTRSITADSVNRYTNVSVSLSQSGEVSEERIEDVKCDDTDAIPSKMKEHRSQTELPQKKKVGKYMFSRKKLSGDKKRHTGGSINDPQAEGEKFVFSVQVSSSKS